MINSNTDEKTDQKNDKKHGIIVLLDKLGTKNESSQNTYRTLEKLKDLQDYLADIKQQVFDINKLYKEIHVPNFTKIIGDSESYSGSKQEDISQLTNLKIEMAANMFQDTILIAIYTNDKEIFRDDILIYYSGFIMASFFRYAFGKYGDLMRGAMSIGDFFLVNYRNGPIILGAPVNEVSSHHESANWGGIIGTPSVNLTLDYYRSIESSIVQVNEGKTVDRDNPIFQEFQEYLKDIEKIKQLLIQYDVPLKSLIEKGGYAVAWPIIAHDEFTDLIKKKLNEFLDYQKFQTEDKNYDIYLKYKNTKLFHDYCHENFEIITFNDL